MSTMRSSTELSMVSHISRNNFVIALCAWGILAIISLGVGRYSIGFFELFNALFGGGESTAKDIIYGVRLPRILLSSLSGGVLALSGLCLQAVFKNPLVGPHIVGVSTGAAFGGSLAILFALGSFFIVSFAFIFGLVAILMLYMLARFVKRVDIFTLVLSGIVVNGFFAALISLVQYIADVEQILPNIVFWLLGSFVSANYTKLTLIASIALPCLVVLMMLRWRFNLLSLDDNDLKALGVNLFFLRAMILLLCTLLIAVQVSVSGNIGWVGLVVPHMARFVAGSDHLKSMPLCFVFGAIFMLLIDNFGRSMSASEIPLGILSALVGTPIFALLLRQNSKGVSGA